jgi:hypothetical protein
MHSYPEALIVIALTAGFLGYQYLKMRERQRRMEILHAERLAAMDKGIPLPELPFDPPAQAWKEPPDRTVPLAIGIVLAAFGFGAMAMLAFLAEDKPYWAVPLPIAMMGLGLVLYYHLSVAAAASDTTTRHGG